MAPIAIMINGLPGSVARCIAGHALQREEFELLDRALTGPEITESECVVKGTAIQLIGPEERQNAIEDIRTAARPFISVDFTHPDAVNANAGFYCRNRLPFVMGTTGGDRQQLVQTVRESENLAVIAPNMAKQIVGFQAMMAYAADTFPGLFNGYSLEIRESHQRGKVDTSGTAKAMVRYFNRLGVPFSESEITKERDPERQREDWKVPEVHLTGHGWHTYRLVSGDRSVRFEFTHNVNGRDVYALGTLDAVLFLQQKIQQGEKGRVYSMIDVLKAG